MSAEPSKITPVQLERTVPADAVEGVGSEVDRSAGDLALLEASLSDSDERVHQELARSSWRHRLLVRALQVLLIGVLLGTWQYMAGGSKTLLLAVGTPWNVMRWIGSWASGGPTPHGAGWSDLGITLEEAGYGYVLGVVGGIGLGAIVGSFRWLRSFSSPFIAMGNAFPKIALAPLFILIFGSSLSMKAYFVAAATFFITFFSVFNGIRSIDPVLVRHGMALGASRRWLVKEVYVPSILGWIISGLRLTASFALASAVIVELLASNAGIGYVVASGQGADNVSQALGGLVIISMVALIIDRLLLLVSRRLSRWRLS